MFGTLADIRNEVRVRLGLPDRGTSGDTRLNTFINMAVRQMWTELPKQLLYEETRIMAEPSFSTGNLSTTADTRVMSLPYGIATKNPTAPIAVDGSVRARTLEYQYEGRFYYRRIQDVYTLVVPSVQRIVLDSPNATGAPAGTLMSGFRIFTEEYPYPADAQEIVEVIRNPDNSPFPILQSAFLADLTNYRNSVGFRLEGQPELYARGSFYQLPSPHYAPQLKVLKVYDKASADAWGFDENAVQQISYGPAGTFEYIVMHVWGRQKQYLNSNEGLLLPFYQSAPSTSSVSATTTWGQGAIEITTPDIDYVYGYGPDTSALSYHHNGVEKWFFRRRLATEETTTSIHGTQVENDSTFYLWRVTQGYETVTIDRGDDDPVDRHITLKATNGHFHIRFDRSISEETPILLRLFRRPPQLTYDTDTPRLPPDCYDCLYALVASMVVGDRDGEPSRKAFYMDEYKMHLTRLRRTYNVAGHQVGRFGNGISARGHRFGPSRNRKITDITP